MNALSGNEYSKTAAYQNTTAQLQKNLGQTPPPQVPVNPITPPSTQQGMYLDSQGRTLFEQSLDPNSPASRAREMVVQRVNIAEQYMPNEFQKAAVSGSYEDFNRVENEAVAKRIQEGNTNMMIQSGIGDLFNAGLLETRGKDNQIYLSEKGRSLGVENLYGLEQNAVWGKTFDLYIGDNGLVSILPEGTRKYIKDNGFSAPFWLEKDGKSYLALSKSGKDTILVGDIDPIKNTISGTESRQFKEFLDLSSYTVSPDASFEYSLSSSGASVKASGVRSIYADALSGFRMNKVLNSPGYLPPSSDNGKARDNSFQFGVNDYQNMITAPDTLMYVNNIYTDILNQHAADEMIKPVEGFERWLGLTVPNPISGFLGPKDIGIISTGPYMFTYGVEVGIKAPIAAADFTMIGLTLGVDQLRGVSRSQDERNRMASEFAGVLQWVPQFPVVVAFGLGQAWTDKLPAGNPISRSDVISKTLNPEGDIVIETRSVGTTTIFKPNDNDFFSTRRFNYEMQKASVPPQLPDIGKAFGDKVMEFKIDVFGISGEKPVYTPNIEPSHGSLSPSAGSPKASLDFIAQQRFMPEKLAPALTSEGFGTFPAIGAIVVMSNDLALGGKQSAAKPSLDFVAQQRFKTPELAQEKKNDKASVVSLSLPTSFLTQLKLEDIEYEKYNTPTRYELAQNARALVSERIQTGITFQQQMRREGLRVGVGTRTGQAVRLSQGQLSMTGIFAMPRMGENVMQRVGVLQRQRVSLQPPNVPIIPALPSIGGQGPSPHFGRGKKAKPAGTYSPSIAGIDLGVTEKNLKRVFSSIEIRGMPNKPGKASPFSFSSMSLGRTRKAIGPSMFSPKKLPSPFAAQDRAANKEQKTQDRQDRRTIQALMGSFRKPKGIRFDRFF